MPDALFETDDYAPVMVKSIRCAACIGGGSLLTGAPCPACDGDGRLGSSIWRGKTLLHSLTSARPGSAGQGDTGDEMMRELHHFETEKAMVDALAVLEQTNNADDSDRINRARTILRAALEPVDSVHSVTDSPTDQAGATGITNHTDRSAT